MCNFFGFFTGTVFGTYLAQNYDIPDVKNSMYTVKKYIETLEKDKNDEDKKNK
tara:strand:- start:1834 stop:1992 length:159 start_codon:yes stop_codon:yes gene_type:complete